MFISTIKSTDVLSNPELSKLEITGTRYDQAKYLLEILETRTEGYKALLKALLETKQTGALDVLLRTYLSKVLPDLQVDLDGRFSQITQYYPHESSTLWTNLTKIVTIEEIATFFSTSTQKEPLKLLNESLPKVLEYYVPRTLSKRLQIKKDIFKHDCKDVFVIKGMQRHKLTELAQSNRTAYSSYQREKITVRFIHLQERDDWEEIFQCSKSPVHLITYEADQDKYLLEKTSGGSSVLQKFLEKGESEDCTISEEKFLHEIENKITKSICICDLPGMGKTLLLANLARNAKQDPKTAVVFVVLQHFVRFRRDESIQRWQNAENGAAYSLFEHITPSKVAAGILFKVVKDNKIGMKIFSDGFDEIEEDDVIWVKKLFKYLIEFPNLRIYVTSRPHMRHELEETLKVVAYDIFPFNEPNQVYFLSNFWASFGAKIQGQTYEFPKLKSFARLCLKHFKESVSPEERDIAGIPLQCRLIAEVYTKEALRYSSRSNTNSVNEVINFGSSMFEMYKRYVDMKFANKLAMATDEVLLKKYKTNHHIIALQTIFPGFDITLVHNAGSSIKNGDNNETNKLMSCGILEEVYNGQKVVFQFIHRTIAEYLVTEFISNELEKLNANTINDSTTSSVQYFLNSLLGILKFNSSSDVDMLSTLLFDHMLRTHRAHHRVQSMNFRYRPRIYFHRFLNSTMTYFFDHQIGTLFATKTIQPAIPLLKFPPRQSFLEIFESCGYHNYLNVFDFIKSCYSNTTLFNKVILKLHTSNQMLCEIISVYCEYSDGVLVERFVYFLKEYFSVTIDNILQISNTNNWVTPLQYACMRKSYDLLELMVVKLKCSTDKQCLVHFCAEHSVNDTLNKNTKSIDMIKLLLQKNANLIRESSARNSPMLAPGSSVDVIKFLVRKGARMVERDSICLTIAHAAPGWMSNSMFHDFIVFVVEERQASKLLKTRDMCDRTVLVEALRKVKLLLRETVLLIIEETKMDLNELNIYKDNLLFAAVWGGQNVQMLEMLINLGVEVNNINHRKENLIHIAAKRRHIEALKYLLSLGLIPYAKDMDGKTPMQLAQASNESIVDDDQTKEEIMKTFVSLIY